MKDRGFSILLPAALLAVLLVCAAALRLGHINWDEFQHVHPDERFIVWVADTISWPGDLATALDPERSTINPFRWPSGKELTTSTGDSITGKPRNYAYGHFPLYLLVIVAHAAEAVAEWFGRTTIAFPPAFQPIHTIGRHLAEYNYLPLVGRAISALADLGTLLLVYAMGRRIGGSASGEWRMTNGECADVRISEPADQRADRFEECQAVGCNAVCNTAKHPHGTQHAIRNTQYATGLLAAAMYAFAVLPIQLSHFAAVDAVLAFLVTATVALAARWAERPGGRTAPLISRSWEESGLTPEEEGSPSEDRRVRGMSLSDPAASPASIPASSKGRSGGWCMWLAAGIVAGLAVGTKFSAVLLAAPLCVAALYHLPVGSLGRKALAFAGRLAAVAAVALAVFAVTNPFAIIEFNAYVGQIMAQNAMVSGVMDAPYTRQYIGTLPYLYFLQQLSQWGLGWPLGIVAWGGFVWAIVTAARRKASPALVVMLAWAFPYFALTGAFHTKFLRYMAPLLPFLIVFGAAAAMAAYRWLGIRWGRRGRVAWVALAAVTAVLTIGWALAFTGVYRQEHPWIAASRWIYSNIPEGKRLLTEHWDDSLPLALDELAGRPPSRRYERVELPLWDPDTPEKLDVLVDELSTSDYMVLASNRLYAPVARLRGRYPMTSQYYRMLFSGDLGYRPIAGFTAYPQIGGLSLRDDNADESFTVYDHPRVLVFENVGRLKAELLRARLRRYLPKEAQEDSGELRALAGQGDASTGVAASPVHRASGLARYSPRASAPAHAGLSAARSLIRQFPMPCPARQRMKTAEAGHCEERSLRSRSIPVGRSNPLPMVGIASGLRPVAMTQERLFSELAGPARSVPPPQAPAPDAPLTLPQPVDTLPVVADFRWNGAADASTPLAVLLWWLAMSLLGWFAWPLLFPLSRGLRDRGYGLARVAGWLLVGWVHWLGVSLGLWQNRVAALAGVTGVLALTGLAGWIVQRKRLAAFWAERRRLLLGEEALFAAAYLAFVGVRLLNPDLWQPWNGGEKFMEFAFLNAILRSPHFPPYDPYFAGGIINYYYYGLYLVSLLVKLTGFASEVAFNLAVPGLFALTAAGLFSVAYDLASGFGSPVRGAEECFARSGGAGEQAPAPLPLRPSAPVAGALAVLLGLLMGNLRGSGWLLNAWKGLVSGGQLPAYDYWAASRVIPNTINEFPLWTFVFADLHPHMIAMPFGLLVVGLALNWVLSQGSGDRGQGTGVSSQEPGDSGQESATGGYAESEGVQSVRPLTRRSFLVCLSTCLLIALALGALGAINTWDLPTYALLVAGAFVLADWRARRWRGLVGSMLIAAALTGLAVLAYWPFYTHYQAQVGGGGGPLVARFLGWVRAASPLGDWLTIWGFFLFLALVYVTVRWRARRSAGTQGAVEESEGGVDGCGGVGVWEHRDLEADPAEVGSGGEWAQRQPDGELEGEAEQINPGVEDQEGGEDELVPPAHPSAEHPVSPDAHAPILPRNRRRLVALLGLLGALALLAGMGRPTAALAALPLCLALPLAFRREASAGEAFLDLLLALGLGIVAGIELVYLRDFLDGGDWYRMNTLFKFSVPAWLFLGLAGGVMLPIVWVALGRAPGWLGLPVRAALVALLGAALVFLMVGVRARVEDRFPGPRPALGTLDGTAYMTVGRYTWPKGEHVISLAPEREAIQWLLHHVTGTPVIAEAPAGGYDVDGEHVGYDYYRAGGLRVASLTGFPTFVGQHQYEQRPGDQVGLRFEQGKEFFATTDIARARELMRDLRVGYVYVGALERILFAPDSLRKFDVMAELGDLAIVHQNPEVTIYRVAGQDE